MKVDDGDRWWKTMDEDEGWWAMDDDDVQWWMMIYDDRWWIDADDAEDSIDWLNLKDLFWW